MVGQQKEITRLYLRSKREGMIEISGWIEIDNVGRIINSHIEQNRIDERVTKYGSIIWPDKVSVYEVPKETGR
jgi:hypothetical protein